LERARAEAYELKARLKSEREARLANEDLTNQLRRVHYQKEELQSRLGTLQMNSTQSERSQCGG
jgi:hypothetical protein